MKTDLVVYCLAGLGLNAAIFNRLNWNAAREVHFLEWLQPERCESLDAYVDRMAKGIAPTTAPLVLVGHSFGGVVMQEISKRLPTKHVILISSIKAKREKDIGMNVLMRAFPVHKLITQKIVMRSFKSWGSAHGYYTPEAQAIFLQAAEQHSTYYYRWATSAIFAWEAKGITAPITHLHGTKDKTFPFRRVLPPVVAVEGGTHFMVYNKAPLISELLNQTLLDIVQ
jgi:pimeloyl-ACP methyl ester carboxylesterase